MYFERERARERAHVHVWGRDRERRDRIPGRLCTVSVEPDMGLELTNCEIMTRAKIKLA